MDFICVDSQFVVLDVPPGEMYYLRVTAANLTFEFDLLDFGPFDSDDGVDLKN